MNLLYDLEKVYDSNKDKIGETIVVNEKINRTAILLPIFHSLMSGHITVSIDMQGNFLDVVFAGPDDDIKTIIPVTLDSDSRTSGIAPHALNDRIDYITGDLKSYYILKDGGKSNENRHDAYIKQLEKWAESPFATPQVQAVLEYTSNHSLIEDIASRGLLLQKDGGYFDESQKIRNTDILSCNVRFIVQGDDSADSDYIPETWLDPTMYRSYIEYYNNLINQTFPHDYCYVSGENIPITLKHSNGIRATSDFGKLISSNEKLQIVYSSERYLSASDVATIGYITSCKAHNALKWLIALQGLSYNGNEDISLAWHDNGSPIVIPFYANTPNTFGKSMAKSFSNRTEYLEAMDEAFNQIFQDNEDSCNGVIHYLQLGSSLKGSLKGRISVLDYRIITAQEFYKNILTWHKTYFWYLSYGSFDFVGAPSVYDVVRAAYGHEDSKGQLSVASKALVAKAISRISDCLIENRPLPADIQKNLFAHATHPEHYKNAWNSVFSIACAVINGTKFKGGEIMLDYDRTDRDYLFGRLLAIANYAERKTFTITDSDRETNAIRYMSDFVKRPATTWEQLFRKLQIYLRKLNKYGSSDGEYYKDMINGILSSMNPSDFTNTPLGATYLLGYSSQSNYFSRRDYARSNAAGTDSASSESENTEV